MRTNLLLSLILLVGICLADLDSELNEMIAQIFNTTADSELILYPTLETPALVPNLIPPGINGPGSGTYKECGMGKECVPRHLCANDEVNRNGAGLIDVRVEGSNDDTAADDTKCLMYETCCSIQDKREEPIDDSVSPCGYRNTYGVGLGDDDVSDNHAQFGEFPWMVGICVAQLASGKINHVYHAGGSLITPKVVLTAAHKVNNKPANSFNVRAGEWDSAKTVELYPHQGRKVLEVIVHEQFNAAYLQNDIALLILESPFQMAPNVQTVCLPPAGLRFDLARCYFTGWGKDRYVNGRYQNILKKVDLPIVPNDQCQSKLRRVGIGVRSRFEFHSSHLCAGGELNKDACIGDGGSPLVCPMTNETSRYFQVGIVVGGAGCGRLDVPGLYANLPQLRKWIDEQVVRKRIESKYFTP